MIDVFLKIIENNYLYKETEHINEIIAGCKKNDRKAQERLYRSFYDSMMNLCIRYTKDEDDAKLVLNTGFLKVFKNIEKYDSKKAVLYTWIRTIVINSCIDHIKSKQSTIVANELHEADAVHVDAEADTKVDANEILHLIKKLPAATQVVFNLYIVEGYGHKEIAILLQISEGTSKWHLSEARKNLKMQLLRENISE
ncbi:MAG TPA: RNA polymerase sigma factor [Ferruginibacter sp.]|nr:RNA polymerase sigma factor [Ferruginibacter sp.]